DAPPVLWAIPEAPTGERLRANALCGIMLSGHALCRAGCVYETIYAAPDDASALRRLDALARAGRARRTLKNAWIGRIGTHPEGFPPGPPSAGARRETSGVRRRQLEWKTLFGRARAVEPSAVEAVASRLPAGVETLDPAAVRATLSAYVALRDLSAREGLDALALRCWPQFFSDLGGADRKSVV